tara:strand:- start:19324 stop:20292 length:969 start_codon:yes stop_codon:yes gene_type:complete
MKDFKLENFQIKIFLKKLSKITLLKIFLKISRILYKNNFFDISIFILKIVKKIFPKNFLIQKEFAQVYKILRDKKNLIKTYDKGISFTKGDQKNELIFMALSDSFNFLKKKRLYDKYFNLLYPKIIKKNKGLFPIVIKFSINEILNIDKEIYNYMENNPYNSYSNHGHYNVYQSEHDLYKIKKFKNYSIDLKTKYIEKIFLKILKYKCKVEFKKMWFVVTKQSGSMKKHNHPDGHFSGVLYYQVPKVKASGFLKIYNSMKNINLFEINNKQILKKKFTHSELVLKPKKNDVFLFSSFLMHSVDNGEDINKDRISLPFDFILK